MSKSKRFSFRDLFPNDPRGNRMLNEHEPGDQIVRETDRVYVERGTGLESLNRSADVMLRPGSAGGPPNPSLPDQGLDPNLAAVDPAVPHVGPQYAEGDVAMAPFRLPSNTPGLEGRKVRKQDRIERVPLRTASFPILTPGSISTAPPTVAIDTQTGFPVKSLQVENYSALWIKVIAGGSEKYIAPSSWRQFVLLQTSQTMRVTYEAPGGQTQGSVTANQLIEIFATEEELPTAGSPF